MSVATTLPQPRGNELQKEPLIKFLTLGQKLWAIMLPCDHNWSFPQTSKELKKVYLANSPYDSHQQCPECGAMRLYNLKEMQGGPLFLKKEKQHG